VTSYLDASALLKLLISERGTEAVTSLWARREDSYASLLGYTELRAAMAAAVRAGRIHPISGADARGEVESVWRSLIAVEIDEGLVRAAGDLAERHCLRAADAIHLASAIVIREPDTVFVTFDARLREAAAAEGFPLLPETV
jgi:predicted nucleic acid-binding protein